MQNSEYRQNLLTILPFYSRVLADAAIASVSPTATGAILDQFHDWEAVALPETV